MSNVITRILRLPGRRKLLLLEAIVCSTSAWFMIRLSPYSMWRSRLGAVLPMGATPLFGNPVHKSENQILKDIGWAHQRLAKLSRAHFTCLMLAFSARAMLRRRKLDSVLVLGVKLKQDEAKDKLGAHAWVLSQGFEVVGGDTRDGHSPVAAYCERGRHGPTLPERT